MQDGVPFCHCEVFRWTPRVARDLRKAVDAEMAAIGRPMFATTQKPHGGDHKKHEKFVKLMGFEFYQTVHVDGVDHAIFVRWR